MEAASARKAAIAKKTSKHSGSTRDKILRVALREFAARGLSGARVDRIAAQVKTSKRMLYYYFKSKEELYEAVLEEAYAGIRATEADIDVDHMDPVAALRSIVSRSFDYHCAHEMFVRLVMNENIHQGRHISDSQISENRKIIETLSNILERGKKEGCFRADIDPRQLHLTISSFGFHFISNRFTFSRIFEMDMSSASAVAQRRAIAIDTVLRWCSSCPENALPRS
jgi:AcrR family transcriptional regulator